MSTEKLNSIVAQTQILEDYSEFRFNRTRQDTKLSDTEVWDFEQMDRGIDHILCLSLDNISDYWETQPYDPDDQNNGYQSLLQTYYEYSGGIERGDIAHISFYHIIKAAAGELHRVSALIEKELEEKDASQSPKES